MSAYSSSLRPKEEPQEYRKELEGVIDMQIHLAPDVSKRACDDLEFAQVAKEAGYRGFVVKNHHALSADRALLVREAVPGVTAFGGLTLNHAVGGLNPEAVEAAINLGAAEVWMPTFNAENHLRFFPDANLPNLQRIRKFTTARAPLPGMSILLRDGAVKPEVEEILGLLAEANVILGTGHISKGETFALVEAAAKAGVKKVLVTHPEFRATTLTPDEQLKLAKMGAIMEHCAVTNYDAKQIAANVSEVGARNCVLSSDSGQIQKGHPLDVMKGLMDGLEQNGISRDEIWVMTRVNPGKLLGLVV